MRELPSSHQFTSSLTLAKRGPERLVGIGFRCWIGGYQTGNIEHWETAWNLYANELGACRARAVVSELGTWVKTIRDLSGREIKTGAPNCRTFCRDECIAISMIAASQHKVCPAMRSCAFALIGCGQIEELMPATEQFAMVLQALNQRLSAGSISCADELVDTRNAASTLH